MWGCVSALVSLSLTRRLGFKRPLLVGCLFSVPFSVIIFSSQLSDTPTDCQKCLEKQKTDAEKAHPSEISHKKYLESEVQRLRKKLKVNK